MKNRVKGRGYEDTYISSIPKHKRIRVIKKIQASLTLYVAITISIMEEQDTHTTFEALQ